MKAIERNVADAGVYQHFYHIATRRLFFPQEICSISYQLSAISYQLSAISYQLSAISYQLSKLCPYQLQSQENLIFT